MGTQNVIDITRRNRALDNAVAQPVTVGVGGATIATIGVHDTRRIHVQIVCAAQTFTAFTIAALVNGSAAYDTLYSAAADFTNPRGLLVGASGDLTTLAAGSTGWFILDTVGLLTVQLTATSANSATVTVYASGS